MAARLPIPGQDDGTWGDVLNNFLSTSLGADGALKPDSVTASQLAPSSVAGIAIQSGSIAATKLDSNTQNILTKADNAPTTIAGLTDVAGASGASDTQVLSYDSGTHKWVPSTVSSTTVLDATSGNKGIIQLSGDLAGSAATPTVPALASKEPIITAGTNSQYLRGDKTFQTLDKTAVGLANVDNISDTNKPVSTAQQAALDLKAALASPTFTGTVTVPVPINPTDATTKTYVDTAVTGAAAPDATTLAKGKIRLAGDLAGTADAPTVAKVNGIVVTGTPSTNQVLTATSTSAAVWSTPTTSPTQVFVATANGVQDTNAYCAPGSHNVASTASLYTQAMVGLAAIFIQGGSGGTTDVVTTVQSVTDSNHLVLAAAVPGGTGNPQTLIIGTDISTALAAAFANAGSSNQPLYIPAGTYIKTSTITVPSNVKISGAGRQETTIIHASSTTNAFQGVDLSSIIFEDWTVVGPGQGLGTGSGISFTLSNNPATFYPTLRRFSASHFGVDGIAIAIPIVASFEQVVPLNNGRHGFNIAGAGQADGTSCSFEACFSAGNWAAGYYLHQMAYTSLNGCAADANGVAYYYHTCIGITESGCGSEETYNFNLGGQTSFTPNGLSRYIFNSKVVMNSPYMIQNVGVSCYVTNGSKVVINDYYEGSPGNTDDASSNPTASLKVDTGCTVIVNNYVNSTAMSLASGTTTLLPDALQATTNTAQQATLSSDFVMSASSANTLLSLTLDAGKWLVTGTITLQQGAGAGNTDTRIVAGTATITGGTASTIRAGSASQPASGTLTALITVSVAGTVFLNAYPVAANTAKATTTANSIAGATSMQAIPVAG